MPKPTTGSDVIPPVHDDPVDPENVTILCADHRRRVAADPEGPSPVVHIAANIPPPCDSERFIIRREEAVSRDEALPVLAARAEAMAGQRRALRELGNAIGGAAAVRPEVNEVN